MSPYRVISRHNKFFIVDFKRAPTAISVDRLKPVHEANTDEINDVKVESIPQNNTE